MQKTPRAAKTNLKRVHSEGLASQLQPCLQLPRCVCVRWNTTCPPAIQPAPHHKANVCVCVGIQPCVPEASRQGHINLRVYQSACVSICVRINLRAYQSACVSICVCINPGSTKATNTFASPIAHTILEESTKRKVTESTKRLSRHARALFSAASSSPPAPALHHCIIACFEIESTWQDTRQDTHARVRQVPRSQTKWDSNRTKHDSLH